MGTLRPQIGGANCRGSDRRSASVANEKARGQDGIAAADVDLIDPRRIEVSEVDELFERRLGHAGYYTPPSCLAGVSAPSTSQSLPLFQGEGWGEAGVTCRGSYVVDRAPRPPPSLPLTGERIIFCFML